MRRLARVVALAGPVIVVLAASKFHAARIADPPYDYTGSFRFAWSLAFMGLLMVGVYGAGLPDVIRTRRAALGASLGAVAVAAGGVSVVQLFLGDALLPRFVVFGSALVLVPWEMLAAAIARDGRERAEDRDRVVMVGTAGAASALASELDARPERPAQLVAAIDVVAASATRTGVRPLCEAVRELEATVVVLDLEAQAEPTVVAQVAELHESGVRVRTLSLFYEEWLGKLPVSELERVSLMFDIGEVHRVRYGRMKRVLDVMLGLAGVVVLGLFIPVVAVANVGFNRGPLWYRQERVGKGGRIFEILKFRTMVPGSDADGADWTTPEDPRVTPLGRLLRSVHLDELPQVVNILRGDLSVVGPRPEQPHYVNELSDKLPFYHLRHLVRPGLTGWAQVKYGYASDENDALEKLQYEFFYLRRQGALLDLRIVGRTVRSVLGRGGR